MKFRKVIFWDKSFVIIRPEQEAAIATAKEKKKPFYLRHINGRDLIEPGAIARITNATRFDYQPEPTGQKMLGAPEISDEKRAENVRKIAKMKEDFLAKVERRKRGK